MPIEQIAWLIWLVLILLLLVIEMNSLEFTFLMLSLGAAGGLIAGLSGLPFWAQVIIAAVLSVLLLFLVKPPLLAALRKNADPHKTNVEALLGKSGITLSEVTNLGGQIRLDNGEIWSAKTNGKAIATGVEIKIEKIDGAFAVIEKEK
jgi:membrane protein implicated in regulation of membrane protease activity